MSLQWTLIAGYLYFEIALVVILILPIASPKKWKQFFRSRLFAMIQERASVIFHVLLVVLSLFLLDAVREMRKYSHSTDSVASIHLASEMKGSVKLFRAQRNFYITGFSIFLAFVVRRLVTMIIIQADLLEKSELIIKEAESAKNLAKTTILNHTMSTGDNNVEIMNNLKNVQKHLEEETLRSKSLEIEVNKWKKMYEDFTLASIAAGDK